MTEQHTWSAHSPMGCSIEGRTMGAMTVPAPISSYTLSLQLMGACLLRRRQQHRTSLQLWQLIAIYMQQHVTCNIPPPSLIYRDCMANCYLQLQCLACTPRLTLQ